VDIRTENKDIIRVIDSHLIDREILIQ